jgi:chaperone modulatory protein CbpM
MANQSQTLILWRAEHPTLTIDELAGAVGLNTELLKRLVGYGIIKPVINGSARPRFPVSSIERLECVLRLRRDLGVNLAGAAVILEMRDHIKDLQCELSRQRRRVGKLTGVLKEYAAVTTDRF